MLKLLSSQKYNSGRRPSQHKIGETSFLTDNKGAIPSNVLTLSNTAARTTRTKDTAASKGLPLHPARMPIGPARVLHQVSDQAPRPGARPLRWAVTRLARRRRS